MAAAIGSFPDGRVPAESPEYQLKKGIVLDHVEAHESAHQRPSNG